MARIGIMTMGLTDAIVVGNYASGLELAYQFAGHDPDHRSWSPPPSGC
jgi:hypothetical protein